MNNSISRKSKFPDSVIIFGVIAPNYKSKLVLIDNTVNSQQHIQNMIASDFIIEMNQMYGKLDWVYAQDGAKCHTSSESFKCLEDRIDVICNWHPTLPI